MFAVTLVLIPQVRTWLSAPVIKTKEIPYSTHKSKGKIYLI